MLQIEERAVLTKVMDIHEAYQRFAELVALVASGTEVVLTQNRTPFVRLSPIGDRQTAGGMVKPEIFTSAALEHETWLDLSQAGLSRAYGEDEPEYTTDLIQEPNPAYEAR